MKNKKSLLKFLKIFILSFLVLELLELTLFKLFNLDLHQLEWGWFGFIIIYGFKYHIFCCLLPAIWAGYKCRHKNCEHDHCEHK